MKISVLGSGNGGCAVAADWSLAGHDVFLFDFEEFPKNIKAISDNNGIYSEGDIEGFAPVKYSGHDIERVIDGSDLIFVVGPAYSTKPFGKVCKKHLKNKQKYIICPGSSGGSIEFKNSLGLDLKNEDVIVSETSTLPYACRLLETGKVKVYLKLKDGLFIATTSGSGSERLMGHIH